MRISKVFLCCVFALSYSYAFNHPEIQWKSVSTEHFVINYYNKTEPAVYSAWKIAEETYAIIAPLFEYKQKRKIEISLADYDDYSNGWADFTSSTIMIWTPDSRFDFRGNTTWLRNVLSHEITHILSLESRKSLFDITASVQVETPSEQLSVVEPFPKVTLYPNWFAEGIAQLGAARLGHDCWDSRREMLLRTAAMNNSLLTLEEMGNFNHDFRGNEMVYNQGYSFISFLENRIGSDALNSIFKRGAQEKINFPAYFSAHLGRSLDAFYMDWKDSLSQFYATKFPSVDSSEQIFYSRGIINAVPRISPDGKMWGWLSSGKDDAGRTDLIICKNGTAEIECRIPYAHTSWAFSKNSKKVYFIKSRNPDKNGSYLNDLFEYDIGTRQVVQITKGARIYDVAVSPLTEAISCVRFDAGVFLLDIVYENGKLTNVLPGTIGEPYVNCSWSPADSSLLVASRIVDGQSSLYIINTKDKQIKNISSGSGQEESPFWGDDNRIYFSADYDGIFNIYSVLPDGTDLKRYTNTTGGCFSPVKGEKEIVYSGYGASGYSISKTETAGVSYEIPSVDRCTFKSLPVPKGKVVMRARPYVPHLGRALLELQIFGAYVQNSNLLIREDKPDYDTSGLQLGVALINSRSDAIGKKSRTIGAALGVLKETLEDDSTVNNKGNLIRTISPQLNQNVHFRENASPRKYGFSNLLQSKDYLRTFQKEILSKVSAGTDDSTENDSSAKMSFVPFFQPLLSITNSRYTPTLSLDISGTMLMMILPYNVSVNMLSSWQLSDKVNVHAGLSSVIYPFLQVAATVIPVSISWSNIGVYNKEINYNLANYSQLSLTAGPQFIPMSQERVEDGYDTTVGVKPEGLFSEFEVFHGVPLGKYASIQLSTAGRVDYYNEKVLDNVLGGNSRTYVQNQTGIKAVFPIVRNINSGSLYYLDALYGSVGYTFYGRANRDFFNWKYYPSEVLLDPELSPDAAVGHFVNVNITLGHYKSYQFFKRLMLDVQYEILRRDFNVSVSAGF